MAHTMTDSMILKLASDAPLKAPTVLYTDRVLNSEQKKAIAVAWVALVERRGCDGALQHLHDCGGIEVVSAYRGA
jgi:hypothetical protein